MSLKFEITGDNSNLLSSLEGAKRGVHNAAQAIESSGLGIEDMFKRIAAAAGIAFSIDQAKGFVNKIIEVRSYFQDIESSMEVFLGSQAKAAEFTEKLKDYAYYNMFEFSELAQASKQMIAYGQSVDSIIPTLDKLSNIATGTNANLLELVASYNKAHNLGRIGSQELASWATRGLVVTDVLKQMGETVNGTTVTFEQLNKAIDYVTAEGGMFHNLMLNQMENLSAEQGQLQDDLDAMYNEIGEKYQDFLKGTIDAQIWAVEHYKEIGQALSDLIVGYGLYRGALVVATSAEKLHTQILQMSTVQKALAAKAGVALSSSEAAQIATKNLLTAATKRLALATKELAAATITNPYFLAAAAIATLMYAVYKLVTADDAETAARKRANAAWDEFSEKMRDRDEAVKGYINIIKSETATELQKIQAYEKLKALMPALTNEYSRQELAALDMADAEKKLNEQRDADEYQKLKDDVKAYREELENLQKNPYAGGLTFGGANQDALNQGKIRTAEANLAEATKRLEEYEANLKKVQDEARPIEIRLQEAKENEKTKKEVFDFYERFMKISDDFNNGTIVFPDDKLGTMEKGYNKLISDLDAKIANLKKEQEKNPLIINPQIGELEKTREQLASAKTEWEKSGYTTLPLTFFLDYTSLGNAVSDAQGLVSSLTGNESTPKKTYTQAYKDAQKAYLTALKEVEKAKKGTEEEYRKAVSDLEAAKSNYKALGGDVTGKTDKANEKKKEKQEKLNEELLKLQNQNLSDDLSLQEEGTQKKLAQINADYEKQKAAILKQQTELAKLNKEAGVKGNANGLTAEQQAEIDKSNELNEKSRIKATAEVYQAEAQAMREFLIEYGTFQEQKLAIAEEYAEKIKKAQTEGERLTLKAQERAALQQVEVNAIKQNIDWGSVFGDFGTMLESEIKHNIEAIRKYMRSDEYGKLDASDQSKIAEALEELKKHTGGDLGDIDLKEIGELTNKFQEAERAMIAAKENEEAAYSDVAKAQAAYENALKSGDDAQIMSAKINLESAKGTASLMSETYNEAAKDFSAAGNRLKESTDKTVSAINAVTSAVQQIKSGSLAGAYEGIKNLTNTLSTQIGGSVGKLLGNISSAMGGAVGIIVEAALGLLDVLKDGIGTMIADLVDLVLNAVNGVLSDLLSGDIIMKPLKSVTMGVGNIINTLTFGGLQSWLGGDSDPTLERDIERLTASNEALKYSIDELSDKMSEAAVADASKVYDEEIKRLNEVAENTREMMGRSAAAYSNGTFGIGGSHSSAAKVDWGTTKEELKQINKLLGKNFTHVSQVLKDLSPEEMYKLATELPVLYGKIKDLADDGYRDAAQFMDQYVDYWKQIQEMTEAYYEKLTSTNFDTIQSDFANALMDMDSDAETFAENFEKYMQQAIINSLVSEQYKPLLDSWYKAFAAYMKDGTISDSEMKALRELGGTYYDDITETYKSFTAWDDMVEAALAQRDALKDTFGWEGSEDSSREASQKGIATASQDSVDELNGRATAIQGHTYSICENTKLLVANATAQLAALQNIEIHTEGIRSEVSELRTHVRVLRQSVDDINLKGVKIKA